MSYLLRPLAIILIFGGASAAAAIGFVAWDGQPTTSDGPADDDEALTLVGYPTKAIDLSTPAMSFPFSGAIAFPALDVPLQNVTMVSVTLRVQVVGMSANDEFNVEVLAPDASVRSGSASQATSLEGYTISVPVIERWERAKLPPTEHYRTRNEAEALRWSAENHTDNESTGPWLGEVTITPPMSPLRSGNASLLLSFTYYEAVAFPPIDEDTNGTPAAAPGKESRDNNSSERSHPSPLLGPLRHARLHEATYRLSTPLPIRS